jgi:hypothetical protein
MQLPAIFQKSWVQIREMFQTSRKKRIALSWLLTKYANSKGFGVKPLRIYLMQHNNKGRVLKNENWRPIKPYHFKSVFMSSPCPFNPL